MDEFDQNKNINGDFQEIHIESMEYSEIAEEEITDGKHLVKKNVVNVLFEKEEWSKNVLELLWDFSCHYFSFLGLVIPWNVMAGIWTKTLSIMLEAIPLKL